MLDIPHILLYIPNIYCPSFSSFVLLKHDIKVRIDENDESLSFYSLYMSLAPIKMAKIEEVPWYHTLACLINGANIETENYKRLGHFEWLSLDSEDEADHPGREENHNIYNINFVSRGDFFFLIKENEPKKIITFSEPLLKVEGGEIIGFIEKMADSDPQNFVHWEVLAPASEDVFKKIAKVYGNENLFETVIENDNYHTAAELRTVFDGHEFFQFQGVTLVEYDANLFTSLLQDIRDAIFPNSNDLQEYLLSDKMPFNNWISLYYTKDNSYSMELKLEEVAASAYSYVNNTLVINITAYTSLENEIGVFLKGKKSGLNIEFKYPTSDMGNDYSENISVTLQELQSGLNLTIPTLAKELTIEDIDSTFVDMRINYEGQNDLFDT